jgi:hypothetical protein
MRGLGDCIYSRAFIKALARQSDVYYETPWPEIAADIPNVRFVRCETPLRTQAKNVARQASSRWAPLPNVARRTIQVGYGHATMREGCIWHAMQKCFGCEPETLDLPPFPRWPETDRPIAVVRPVTERKEWHNSARGPLPEYVAQIAADLMATHCVISIADLEPGVEWLVGEAPPADIRLHAGELGVRDLLGLVQSADVVVGGVGWVVPACIAARTNLFCILGGQGGHNRPDRIVDQRMDASHVGWATPDRFCQCEQMRHDCIKTISNLSEQWSAFRRERGL